MKFKNRIGVYFIVACLLTIAICLTVIILVWTRQSAYPAMNIWISLLLIATALLMIWLWKGTSYELDSHYLTYKSGPIKGKVKMESIREIVVGKTLWAGLKPATAVHGIIIRYNKHDEIYISPLSNEHFVKEILKLNPNIKVIRPK